MRTSAVVIMILMSSILIGLPFQNVSAGTNMKINEPVWGKTYTQYDPLGNTNHTCYAFNFHSGDNLTINITNIGGNSRVLYLGGTQNGLSCNAGTGSPFVYTSTSDEIKTSQEPVYLSNIVQYWVVSGTDQSFGIWIHTDSTGTISYQINKINATPPQDPAIKDLNNQIDALQTNLTDAQARIAELQTNMTYVQTVIQYLAGQIHLLNTTITNMNDTQQQMLDNITALWASYNKLNLSLDDLFMTVNDLDYSFALYQNLSKNITKIETDLYNILNQIEDLTKDKDKLKDVQNLLNTTIDNITAINYNLTLIKSTMPKAYNDTALKSRVAQLEAENDKLTDDLKSINKKQEQASVQRGNDFKIVVLAIIIGIVGIMFGVFALIFAPISRMPKGLDTQDLNIVKPPSDDYDELEQSPRYIPKAKAKKK